MAPDPAVLRLDDHALKQISTCVHCGFCLPACPTYRELGNEMDSPRGRIYLMKALHDGRAPFTPAALQHLDLCLDCRACETACPSGVGYGAIVESARAAIDGAGAGSLRPWWARWLRRFFLRRVFPSPHWLAALASLTRFAQRTGLIRLAALLPRPLAAMAPVLPPVPPRPSRATLPSFLPARGSNQASRTSRPGSAALHLGCVMDVLFAGTNAASARLLTQAGYDVHIPSGQICCGSLHQHGGDAATARALAQANIATWEATGAGILVSNAAGCGAHLKAYPLLFADDPAWQERARVFSARVRDLTEALAAAELPPPPRPCPRRVAYQDACHLAHGQGIRTQPRQLLAQVPGIELVEMANPDACCGSAGIYNITEHELSQRILGRKMESALAPLPEVLVTANPGCYLQLRLGVQQSGQAVEVMHIADLLAPLYSDP